MPLFNKPYSQTRFKKRLGANKMTFLEPATVTDSSVDTKRSQVSAIFFSIAFNGYWNGGSQGLHELTVHARVLKKCRRWLVSPFFKKHYSSRQNWDGEWKYGTAPRFLWWTILAITSRTIGKQVRLLAKRSRRPRTDPPNSRLVS